MVEQDPRKPEPIRRTTIKPVTIKVANNRLIVDPLNLTLRPEEAEEAGWRCDGGDLEIRFAPGSNPFRGDSFRTGRGGVCLSGVPIKEKTGQAFRYTIIVTTPRRVLISQTSSVSVESEADARLSGQGGEQQRGLSLFGLGLIVGLGVGLLAKIRARF